MLAVRPPIMPLQTEVTGYSAEGVAEMATAASQRVVHSRRCMSPA